MRAAVLAMCALLAGCGPAELMSAGDVPTARKQEGARIPYGPGASQFVEYWRPLGRTGPHKPVVVLIHGGCWQAEYSLDLMDAFAAALVNDGFAVVNVEYRRLGEPGGGYSGTFQDVGAAIDAVRTLAPTRGLDLTRVVLVGHSAGGHLALWAAARAELPESSPLRTADPLPVRGVLSLGGVGDLQGAAADPTFTGACGAETIGQLVGTGRPDPYADTSPARLPLLDTPEVMLHGAREQITPAALGQAYADAVNGEGGRVSVEIVPDAGHFEVISPGTPAFNKVLEQIETLAG